MRVINTRDHRARIGARMAHLAWHQSSASRHRRGIKQHREMKNIMDENHIGEKYQATSSVQYQSGERKRYRVSFWLHALMDIKNEQ